jgi:hypothetical protein
MREIQREREREREGESEREREGEGERERERQRQSFAIFFLEVVEAGEIDKLTVRERTHGALR